jgi:putative ABC transport system substrate-binding protein
VTKTIPVVMAVTGDPVAAGIVASFARPGGNLTGMSFHFPEIMAKRLEAMTRTARALKLELHQIDLRGPAELDQAFEAMAKQRIEAIVVQDDGTLIANARAIADHAARRRIPAIGSREFVDGGGLLGYAVDFPAIWRKSAILVDKVLRGARPADLPIEQAERLELIVNLKTAKALGLTLPQSLMERADHFIQ